MSEPFLAEIRMIGFNFAPRGHAFCDGQLLPITLLPLKATPPARFSSWARWQTRHSTALAVVWR